MWYYEQGQYKFWNITDLRSESNAAEVWAACYADGWTLEACAGLLGNIQQESTLNPAITGTGGGGLIGWTPLSQCSNYVASPWYNGANQMDLIIRELNQTPPVNGRYYPTSAYPYTGAQFKQLTDVRIATLAYLYNRERAGIPVPETRINYANYWYEFLGGGQPTPPTPPEPPTPPTPPPFKPRKYNRKKRQQLYKISDRYFI